MKDFADFRQSGGAERSWTGWARCRCRKGGSGWRRSTNCWRGWAIRKSSLPPVFHVAGTNGKGSTCAFLRAMLEAEGLRVHVATKPHLVRYNERIRVGGELISDAMLASCWKKCWTPASDLAPSFFEVTTAATFLAFARNLPMPA